MQKRDFETPFSRKREIFSEDLRRRYDDFRKCSNSFKVPFDHLLGLSFSSLGSSLTLHIS